MTPFELERARSHLDARLKERRGATGPIISAIADALKTILQHLAEVEGDRNLDRAHAERVEERVDVGQT